MKKIILFNLLIISIFSFATAQNTVQNLRGSVLDADANFPIVGATVEVFNTSVQKQAVTNRLGEFRIENLPVGRYSLKVQMIGYQIVTLEEVLIESGKETIRQISLKIGTENLQEVVVSAERPQVSPLSVQQLTVEQTQRFAATFFDPARLVTSFAGVIAQNDQANNLIVRGNSPVATTWWLEGVEIVNPNHTPNAGTMTDRVTASGGGVNMLSMQLLGDARFLKGNFPIQYGNALGGILDMKLRSGNNEQYEWTAQIGLIGVDFAAEGPISKENRSSFLVNYRYSTLGILGAMGVNLGDEAISFQDVAFKLNFPSERFGELAIFGMAGNSRNTFEAKRDSSLWEFQKDNQDIFFSARMGALGFTHQISVGSSSAWKTALVFSALESDRYAYSLDSQYSSLPYETDLLRQSRLSAHSFFQQRLNDRQKWQVGIQANQIFSDLQAQLYVTPDSSRLTAQGTGQGMLFRPYAHYEHAFSPTFSLQAGVGYAFFTFNETAAFEPRLAAKWQVSNRQTVGMAYRLQSQLQQPTLYFSTNVNPDDLDPNQDAPLYNQDLGFTKAHHFGVNYRQSWAKGLQMEAEMYYQNLFDVPISTRPNSTFSALNLLESSVEDTLANLGTGRNYGIELTVQRLLKNGIYYQLAGSWYESKYTAADGIERDTRFNANFSLVLTGGKEWQWRSKSQKDKMLGLNIKVFYVGGLRSTPIDVAASKVANQTIYLENQAFNEQLPAFFKVDFRVYYKQNHSKYNSTLALDIQNLTNQKNIAFQYFDPQQGEVVVKYQLGLIPLLVYRLEF